jgi:hypothetical protein
VSWVHANSPSACGKTERAERGPVRVSLMRSALLQTVAIVGLAALFVAPVHAWPQNGGDFSQNTQGKKLPTEVILVKGAWSSASDSTTPVPEGGRVARNSYTNDYFGLTYPLTAAWVQKYAGPPPSDSGYYVLAQIRPSDTFTGPSRATILIAAQDMFFNRVPATTAFELINFSKDHLSEDYVVEQAPTQVEIANHSFVRFDYVSPVADLHWQVLATQIRCHTLEFIFTSSDSALTESLIQQMNAMKLPEEAGLTSGTGGGNVPACIKDYASGDHVMERDDPIFTERTFNSVPVRIVIDKEGRVKHIHFLSALPSQAKVISDTLARWRFRPYLRDGQPVEVETGIMFGRPPRVLAPATSGVSE